MKARPGSSQSTCAACGNRWASATVAHELLASLDGEPEAGADEGWSAEITRRAERFLGGESKGIPWEEAKARLVERFGPK